MGVEHYLVDVEGKNVLACGKWYALDAGYGDVVTVEQMRVAEAHDGVYRWLREVCQDRPVIVRSDSVEEEWLDPLWFDPLPGWSVYELMGADGYARCVFRERKERDAAPDLDEPTGPWWPDTGVP